MSNDQLQEQAIIQSVYMDYLLTKAKELAVQTRNPPFDPQGRLLVDVTLCAQDYETIARNVSRRSDGDIIIDPSPQGLMLGLGRKFEEGKPHTTTVSLDAQGLLKNAFHQQLKASLKKAGLEEGAAKQVIKKLEEQPKGSIIALQQEMHFHLGLANRVYQQKIPPAKAGLIESSHQAAMARVNELVMGAYAKALKKASNDGTTELSLSDLNKAMDLARQQIAPQAHVILVQEMMKRGIKRDEIRDANYKKLTEKTTASPNDVLHLDPDLGIATLIEGSENTAHHRVAGGEHLATRQLMTHYYTGDGIAPNVNSRIQIRTPSIDEKKKLSEKDSIDDIKRKLEYIADKHKFSEALERVPGKKPAAFVYNLHTALKHFAGDRGGNLQSQGATRILQGAHQYNAEQLARQRNDGELPVLCLVQNISVNGFGKTLGSRDKYPLVNEAALMSELAILHTLYNSSPQDVKTQIEGVFKQYEAYLKDKTPNKNPYFSQSDQGKACLKRINQIKAEIRNPQPGVQPLNSQEEVTRALQQIFANNLHEQHQYSKLTQVLSIYLEEGSISGCKSGNERAQAVNGRVAILDAALAGRLGAEGLAIRVSLDALSTGHSSPQSIEDLKSAIDVAYNKYGLQGAASIVSLLDQGAAAKVKGKKEGTLTFQSTNNAEENKSVMTNLQQGHAGDMQAHKGAPDAMYSAVNEVYGRTFGQFMSDAYSSFGKGIIATVFLPFTLIAGLVSQVNTIIKATQNEEIHRQFLKEQAMVEPRTPAREPARKEGQHEHQKECDLRSETEVVQKQDWRTSPSTHSSMGESSNSSSDMREVCRRYNQRVESIKGLQTPLLDSDDQQDSERSDLLTLE